MKNTYHYSRLCWLVLMFWIVSSIRLPAQDSVATSKWHYLPEPYVIFPNRNGTIGVGNLPNTDINEDPGDIFSKLEMGAMLYAEAHINNRAITSDLLYMKLGGDAESKKEILSGTNAK